jgi:hypothetical protein
MTQLHRSVVEVKNIWAEDLFEWFCNHISSSSGDGAGIIICGNPDETSAWFIDWYNRKYNHNFPHLKDTYSDIINYHDDNENFMFTDNPNNNKLYWHDYIFIVTEDCFFASKDKRFYIKAINNDYQSYNI